jgi:putative component of membrane protein insertase Oxa1/YidC/SpoIIIJ protein YidD
MKNILLLLFFSLSLRGKAQDLMIEDKLLNSAFQQCDYNKTPYRSVMKIKHKSFLQKINPVQYISAALMFSYQRFLSPQLQATCMYQTSCSEYTKLSVEQLGLFPGVMLGFYQFQSCFSKVNYDYPEYKIDHDHKIINQIGLEK